MAERQPLPPNPQKVEALIEVMANASAAYTNKYDCSMSDIFSAIMTMTYRTTQHMLYHTDPHMTERELFQMRKTIIKGVERLWTLAAGGGPTSRFGAH
jgi:hypothetical protein